jgi:hypothetical protein
MPRIVRDQSDDDVVQFRDTLSRVRTQTGWRPSSVSSGQ